MRNMEAIKSPGTMPPISILPTDCRVNRAKKTIGTLGGMRMAKEPDPATQPTASFLS